jgi:hypothetical protein
VFPAPQDAVVRDIIDAILLVWSVSSLARHIFSD